MFDVAEAVVIDASSGLGIWYLGQEETLLSIRIPYVGVSLVVEIDYSYAFNVAASKSSAPALSTNPHHFVYPKNPLHTRNALYLSPMPSPFPFSRRCTRQPFLPLLRLHPQLPPPQLPKPLPPNLKSKRKRPKRAHEIHQPLNRNHQIPPPQSPPRHKLHDYIAELPRLQRVHQREGAQHPHFRADVYLGVEEDGEDGAGAQLRPVGREDEANVGVGDYVGVGA